MMDLEITQRLQINPMLVLQYGAIQHKTDTVVQIQMATATLMKALVGQFSMVLTLSLTMAHNGLTLMETVLATIIFKALIIH